MRFYAQTISKNVINLLRSEKNFKIQVAIEKVLKEEYPTLSDAVVSDQAFSLIEKVRYQLNKYLNNCAERKISPPFKWGEIDKDIIISHITEEPTGVEEPDEAKFRLTGEFQEYLKNLDPKLFEKLGENLLESIGCESFVTRSSKDEGIDFGGILKVSPIDDDTGYSVTTRVMQSFCLNVIGQAKRYSDEITVREVRELQGVKHHKIIQSLSEKHKDNEIINNLSNSSYPFVLLFITTSRFTRDAKIFAKNVGMLLMDGEQLAQALLHMDIGCNRNEDGSWEFDESEVNNWIHSLIFK